MYTNKRHLTIVILVIQLFCFNSCISIIARRAGLVSDSPEIKELYAKGKEVYFLGMSHLAKKEFYSNTKKIIEDYERRGFVIYAESISENDSTDMALDTICLKKIRKITGLDLTKKHIEGSNPFLQKLIKKYDLVNQPSYPALGSTTARRVDYSFPTLIQLLEEKFAAIKLDSCDLITAMGENYSCDRSEANVKKLFDQEILLGERNRLVATTITQSADKKILVIFGKAHFDGLKEELAEIQIN